VRVERYQAYHDVLAITLRLERVFRGVTAAETHLLCYLSCLLALYRGLPVAEWGYEFVRSTWGAPFSPEINEALEELENRRFLVKTSNEIGAARLTPAGHEFASFLQERGVHSWRMDFINGATGSALAIPPGAIREALRQEPSLRSAEVYRGTRRLLESGQLSQLYDQFSTLSAAVGIHVSDLMVPSVVWLTYLAEVQSRAFAEDPMPDDSFAPADSRSPGSKHSAGRDNND
jgi:hypothetical protein